MFVKLMIVEIRPQHGELRAFYAGFSHSGIRFYRLPHGHESVPCEYWIAAHEDVGGYSYAVPLMICKKPQTPEEYIIPISVDIITDEFGKIDYRVYQVRGEDMKTVFAVKKAEQGWGEIVFMFRTDKEVTRENVLKEALRAEMEVKDRANRRVLLFTAGRDGEPISRSIDKVCLVDRKSVVKPRPGEVWECEIMIVKEKCVIVKPIKKLWG